MEVVVLVEGEVEFMGLLEVCIMGLGDLVMVGAWVATVEVMVGALEDFWEEIFGEKEAVFLELLSSCRFPPASLSIGEVASADLGGLFPRGRARDGNAHPEVLELGPSAGVLLGGHGVAVH